MPTDPTISSGRQSQAIQEHDSNAVAPPPPTRKRKADLNKYKGQANSNDSSRQQINEDNELLQRPPETLDSGSIQRLQGLTLKYKQWFEKVEQEKGTLINQSHDLQLRYDEVQGKSESEKKRWQQRAHNSDIEVSNLKKQLAELKNEASMYQSALGKATNVRWGDEDSNNLVQLTKVIREIVNSLTEITTVKGRDITIDDDATNELFQKYKCSTRVGAKSWKPILAAALQRLIVQTLFEELATYLNQTQVQAVFANIRKDSPKRSSSLMIPKKSSSPVPVVPVVLDNNNNLEAEISVVMTQLVGLVNHLAESREGTDDITKITPIKIRQQIYAVLGTRGFCKPNHPFIDQLTTKILDMLSRYRQIKNEERLADLKENANKLIREIVHLYFRLNAQEPVPEFTKFFEAGTPVQNNLMDGAWDDDVDDNLLK
ncbi:10857_t:CDS:2 [Funneliformis geosporum]|uniref:18166_t:CDS:1 n=1 Tax=Funneliformis geosporum TaxID=1117311 RepID=A0A9W4SB71_9GLOM|nr:10857_t:CDS:2 [Funneliformis geosporum]CAI2163401.1 18166_t:CDS:2 [Funneliformis geosporum]